MRQATLVGGIATGALLLAGSAVQAAETQTEEAGLGGLPSAPELLDGLPAPISDLPGVGTVQDLPVPGVDGLGDMPAEQRGDYDVSQLPDTANPIDELLDNLGGGLPVPLPF